MFSLVGIVSLPSRWRQDTKIVWFNGVRNSPTTLILNNVEIKRAV